MLPFILLALFNGVLIGASRSLNGRLAHASGAFYASFWNHLTGFGLLTLILLLAGALTSRPVGNTPVYAYLGGVIGACYVAVNSYVLPKLGTLKALILVISGQMTTAVVIDRLLIQTDPVSIWAGIVQPAGITLIITGVYLGHRRPNEAQRQGVVLKVPHSSGLPGR